MITKNNPELNERIKVAPHAAERLIERMGCSKAKVKKIAVKAWLAKKPDIKRISIDRRYNTDVEYRELMGYIFVFGFKLKDIVLITVLDNTKKRYFREVVQLIKPNEVRE